MGALLDLARRAYATDPKPGDSPALSKPPPIDTAAKERIARAQAFLLAHPTVKRACFADTKADPDHIILTVAVREPFGALEVRVRRERFDALALIELSLRYPDTALNVPEH